MVQRKGVGKKTSVIALFGLLVGVGTVYAESNIENTYHVYVDDKRVGTVEDKEIVQSHIEKEIELAEETYGNWQFDIEEDVSFEEETAFSPEFTEEKVLSYLDDELTVNVEAVALTVSGEEVAYLPTEDKADEVIEKWKTQFVKRATLEAVEERKAEGKEPEIGVDESLVVDVKLSEDVSHETKIVEPKKISTVDEAFQTFQTGKEVIHLSSDQLMSSRASESTGETEKEVKLSPLADVIVKEEGIRTEEIDAETETVKTDKLYQGETKVKQKGSDGKKTVHFVKTMENGKEISEEIVKETVEKEPVKRVVLEGTKDPSVGTGTFLWPAYGGSITSHKGPRWGRQHNGIDIAGVGNRTIRAADNGTVVTAEYQSGFGNKVVIDHNNGYRTVYAHLSSIDVQVGQSVKKGSSLGLMGTTGNSTGVHLHFEVHQNGVIKNPMDYL
ncbi:peptidoglycan DD-metalloendopeptidase family protein [Halobacillus litoralis]|uniref:peptidoglycan DD-metalloendopeptidase family protein n=1 Tax=Halobacillus litoralis TaxID=45668 RepID=UPI001CD7F243|nr:peptidoglycan DD-metalloendopeptidase family protein [Halobacillus litoralis]MCA0972290.1 peptidoglycan DD-metalloendopeptidase family protein [Halobacillus litoralis]